MFFSTPESIDTFFKHVHKGKKVLEKAYKKADLIKIAANLGISDLKGTKKQLVDKISSRLVSLGPGTQANLRKDILERDREANQAEKASKTLIKQFTKPYDDCSIEELKEEAETEGLIDTGSRDDIIDRLEALDAGTGKWEDCTIEFIQEELDKHGFISTGNRTKLLARVSRYDGNFKGPSEDRTTEWLTDYLASNARLTTGSRDVLLERANRVPGGHVLADYDDEYLKEALTESHLPVTGTRKDWLLTLYPIEIAILQKAVNGLDKQLKKKPSVVYRTKYRSHKKSSGPGILGSMARGAAFGAGLGLGARILGGRRRVSNRTTLKF
tara:strand:- start:493 stop:1473 length:981 start_codon:yes stop_codon:yes gene_type:complete